MLAGAAKSGDVSPSWTSVADRLIQTPVESYPFDWGEGVQMMGLMRAAHVARVPRYVDYVEKWAEIWEAKDLPTLLNIGPNAKPKQQGYSGHWSPASAVLYLYQERRRPAHLKLARGVADFIRTGAERDPEGGLGHWQGSRQFWVDTLYMACPLLAGMGRL
jgi:rhamnogalacturonyl hydrolase YesR